MTDMSVLNSLEAGFRDIIGTIDQVFRLQLLYWKHVNLWGGRLDVLFVDVWSATDLVPRESLWKVLVEMGV